MRKVIRQYQSEIYGNYRKAYLLYGVLTGALISFYVLFLRIIILPVNSPETYGTDIALLLCMMFFSYRYRKQLPENRIFFKELMLLNLGIGVIAAIVYGLFLLFYGNVIDTEFFSRCLDTYINNMTNSEQPETQKAIVMEAYRRYQPLHWAAIGAFRTAVMGIMMAFIAALIFRTEKNVVKQ